MREGELRDGSIIPSTQGIQPYISLVSVFNFVPQYLSHLNSSMYLLNGVHIQVVNISDTQKQAPDFPKITQNHSWSKNHPLLSAYIIPKLPLRLFWSRLSSSTMLNTDTLILIYGHLDLESCIQFSQVCSVTNHLFRSLKTLLSATKCSNELHGLAVKKPQNGLNWRVFWWIGVRSRLIRLTKTCTCWKTS